MKDFIEKTCEICGRTFARPYPSMQYPEAVAPTPEEARIVADGVLEDFKYHQNKEHFNSN